MGKVVELENEKEFHLTFGGKDFTPGLTFVKQLPGRLFHGQGKYWTVPISPDVIQRLKADRWSFLGPAYDLVYGVKAPTVIEQEIPRIAVNKSLLHKDLRPYQQVALEQICGLRGKALLSFPPGCGKTAVAASIFRVSLENAPALVVCPAFLKPHWRRELMKWGGVFSFICSGRKPRRPPHKVPVWIINYEILQYWQEVLVGQRFITIIIDECQKMSNDSAMQTKSLLAIAKLSPKVIALSGTPIKNRPKEFYNILHLLAPKLFPNSYHFFMRYCNPTYGYAGLEFKGASNIEELHKLVSSVMIRKEKHELLPELPPKVRYVIPMELSEPEAYKQYEQDIQDLIAQNKKKEAYEQLLALSCTAFPLKKDSVIAWIDKWLEENPDESLVIMAYHHAVIDYLNDVYTDAIVIDGRRPANKRQEQVDDFQEGKARILIGQIQAAGIGFTLTKASTMVVAEVCYVPGDLEQAEDRLERISQLADRVEIYYLVGEGTIEDSMMDSVQKKANNLSRILDGKAKEFFNGK